MRSISFVLLTLALAGCSWETYQTQDGHTALRQKYPQRRALMEELNKL